MGNKVTSADILAVIRDPSQAPPRTVGALLYRLVAKRKQNYLDVLCNQAEPGEKSLQERWDEAIYEEAYACNAEWGSFHK